MHLKRRIVGIFVLVLFLLGLAIPQRLIMPVEKADQNSYNKNSFWFYPWGKSGTHKGVDIFAMSGTPVLASTSGVVIFCGEIDLGGNTVLVLGPKWRLHYYAHLKDINTEMFSWASAGERIGTVGNTGNAAGKPPHLHYSIITLVPFLWKIDRDKQGWKKMFYLDPIEFLKEK
jgi:peptidoglycan LD-endopeptidase LytH